jgi:hypothetical protein
MQRTVGTTVVEGLLIDWAVTHSAPGPQVPVSLLDDRQVAAELDRLQRDRARTTAREAELILRLAELRPDVDDPPPGSPGARARSSSRVTDLEFPGVSEFFVDEVAHSINLGRGTAAFRARRAWTWRENLPATYAALRDGRIDERRAGVLADALQHIAPELARAVESDVLPQALDLAPAALRRRALALLTELDTDAVDTRREEAERAADVRVADAGDGMATLTADLRAEHAAACYDVIDQLAHMARSDGDARPIGQLRGDVLSMLVLRPADHGLADVRAQVTVTACLEGLEGTSARGGEVGGFVVTAGHLRDLLRRVGALGLTAPDGGSLTFALTDADGRLAATATPAELTRRAATGCPQHPGTPDCTCPALGPPAPTEAYRPTDAQRRFVTTRDRRCRMPNCGQRAGWSDLDHVVPHGRGGETSCGNLCCACRSHHRLKTFARGWTFALEPDGALRVTSASGITRTTRPPGMRSGSAPPPRACSPGAGPSLDPPDPDPPPF